MNQGQDNIPQVPMDTAELQLIQKYFKDNDALLLSMRAVMLNLDPTEQDKELVKKTFTDAELMKAVRYRFLPEPKRDTPIGQIQDIWLGAEGMVFGQHRDAIEQAVGYKAESIKMTGMALDLLVDPEMAKPTLAYSPAQSINDPLQIALLARNQFMRHVEQQLLFLKLVAEQQVPDGKAAEKKKKKNSTE